MAKVKLGLRNLSASETIIKGTSILYQMQGNPNFPPETTPPLSEIAAQLAELRTTTANAMNHDKVMITRRNQKHEEFLVLLRKLGGWVSMQTDNIVVIQSSGFDVIEKKHASPEMTQPERARSISNAGAAQLKIMWRPVQGATQYVVETTTEKEPYRAEVKWNVCGYSSQAKLTIDSSELKPLTPYYFRVRALGTSGIGPPSDIVRGLFF
ncbi:MAG: fibronectin type III domain-containing protein [Chitinophagales bacterium]|nr:fibronectin type III domain-containing protein [Chitinophagales bacterium]